MLLKVVGSLLVFGAATAVGVSAARELDDQVAELQRLEVACETLSAGVSYLLEPLPRAMMKAGERAGGASGDLFFRMGSLTGISGLRTPEDAFQSVLAEGVSSRIPRAGLSVVEDLVKTLGTSGHKEQVRYIDMSIDRVRSYRKSIEDEYRKKARMYRYLGVLAGLLVVVVLI
jgi:stage III sporulation protein AB